MFGLQLMCTWRCRAKFEGSWMENHKAFLSQRTQEPPTVCVCVCVLYFLPFELRSLQSLCR